ncbi:MAG TPA: TetR/AcrR family transcriptional regulator [Pseudonocardiaceae bacterium]|jgi:AcrR family transcriptional regulator|nr:TetR/AcrR family transcriptional regulator [Pseudonocardiaceae bacterium]
MARTTANRVLRAPRAIRRAGVRSAMEERIIASAVALFAEQGFDATTVQQVVDRAEVTKGALYHYFDAKDDLLYEIYHALIGTQTADLDEIVGRGLGASETVRQILVNVVCSTVDRLPEAAVFFREAHKLDADRMAAFRADRRRYHESFRAIIANGQADGEFAAVVPPDTVVQIAMGVVNQLPVWYRPGGQKSATDLGNEIADFVLAALKSG